ncbi:hypothetical protein Droror1_Dr00023248 [Drosera rotundifolia]
MKLQTGRGFGYDLKWFLGSRPLVVRTWSDELDEKKGVDGKQGAGILAEVDQSPPEPILVGVGVMHFVEQLGSSNLVNLHFEVDRAFKTLSGRVFAAIWLLVSTLAVARAFLYLAEARVDKRHRSLAKWVLGQDMTVAEFLAVDIDNNDFVSKSQLKEMGKVSEKDIFQICQHCDNFLQV